jgi:hypothetical protein
MELLELLLMSTVTDGKPIPKAWSSSYKELCCVLESLVRVMATAAAAAAATIAAACTANAAASLDLKAVSETVQASQAVARVVAGFCNPVGACMLPTVAARAACEEHDPLLLFSLQCSQLKLSNSLLYCELGISGEPSGNSSSRQAGITTAAAMLQSAAAAKGQPAAAGRAAALSAVAGSVPWLVLFGRYCLQLADNLPHFITPNGNSVQPQGWATALPPAQLCVLSSVVSHALKVAAWLGQPRHQARLVATGYPAELVAQMAAAGKASELLAAAKGEFTENATQFLAALKAMGTSLTVLALPQCCNNPSCSNTSKQSELELVAGRSCKCSQCRVAHYCCKTCQAQHWKQHKAVCKALAALPKRTIAAAAVAAQAGVHDVGVVGVTRQL